MGDNKLTDAARAEACENARQKIARAKKPDATRLDLDPCTSDNKTRALTAIPPEIVELINLVLLDLQITKVANISALGRLSRMRTLAPQDTPLL